MTDEQDLLDYDETDDVPRKEDKNGNNGVISIQNGSSTGTQSGAVRGSYVSIHASGFKDFLLKPELLRSIMDCGFEHPSEVQHESIPQAILGTDIVCQAKSGMGKTAVFVLATLQQLEPVDGQVSVIVLCHTRELAFQISREYERFCKYMPAVKVSVFFGGLPTKNDEDVLKKNCPHIVVGTPGRILALAKSKALNLRYVKHFITDECDKVLDSIDMRRDVQEIFKMAPHEKQVLMFSATLSKEIRPVCKKFMQHPMEIYIDNETKLTLHGLRQHYVKLRENEKNRKLIDLLDKLEFNQVVIFVKSVPRSLAKSKALNLRYVKHFITDECDKVLESIDMRRDVQEIFKMTPHEKQVLMFSATLSKEIRPVCKKFMQHPMEIYIDNETKLTLHGLRQHYVKLRENEKNRKLIDLLDKLEFNQVVIFVKSVPRCTALCKLLTEQNFPAVEIHRGMPQEERLARYKEFKEFQTRILVATNLFGRGMDIERVNIVFNYDMPEDSDTYLHRVARAGRFGTKGLAITYVADESDAGILNEVQSRFEVQITEMPDEIDVATYIENR
ncbi:unnamed protein product [Rotaria socialis]|uniref:RNA helicase n=10 Tax=Rotaria TaxID=231623 RepID=A0A818H162_9BILA|nr:unnamed protein product [Rotaria socialis]